MGKSGAIRNNHLNAGGMGAMVVHENREDLKGSMRVVRDVPPLVFSPYSDSTPKQDIKSSYPQSKNDDELELERILALIAEKDKDKHLSIIQAYERHVENALRNKAAKNLCTHSFIQFPTSITITPESEREMLAHAVSFVNKNYGGNAVFHARLDRDEVGQHGVDVFHAARYKKTTAKGVAEWISLTKFGKALARARFGQRGKTKRNPKTKTFDSVFDKAGKPVMVWNDSKRFQGRALQDLFLEYMRDTMGLDWVKRGEKKTSFDTDRLEPEEYKLQKDQEALKAKELELNALEEKISQAEVEMENRIRKAEESINERHDANRLLADQIVSDTLLQPEEAIKTSQSDALPLEFKATLPLDPFTIAYTEAEGRPSISDIVNNGRRAGERIFAEIRRGLQKLTEKPLHELAVGFKSLMENILLTQLQKARKKALENVHNSQAMAGFQLFLWGVLSMETKTKQLKQKFKTIPDAVKEMEEWQHLKQNTEAKIDKALQIDQIEAKLNIASTANPNTQISGPSM